MAKGHKMFNKAIGKSFTKSHAVRRALFTLVLGSAAWFSRTTFSQASPAVLEFPAFLRQNVTAGTTPVETKIQAKLAVATLVNSVVVPQDAILSGEVIESVAKSASNPSRLAIRMDSAQWKGRSEPLMLTPKLYLTAWYYPAPALTSQELSAGQPDAAHYPRVGSGTGGVYPGQRNPTAPTFPDPDTGTDTNKLPAPASDSSKHRVLMKDVESVSGSEGGVALTSRHSNIKLDKSTTYVFAAGELASGSGFERR